MTPPTQLAIRLCFALRVGVGAALGGAGWVVSDRDGVPDCDLVGSDVDILNEQPQDALAFGDCCRRGLVPQSCEEVLEVVGEGEVDLSVGELCVECVDLLAQAGFTAAQFRHPGPEFIQGDQLLLVGADEPFDCLAYLGEPGAETAALDHLPTSFSTRRSYLYLWIVSRRLPDEYAIALILSIRREGSSHSQFRHVPYSSTAWSQTGHDFSAM
jgi:hypothetical protein